MRILLDSGTCHSTPTIAFVCGRINCTSGSPGADATNGSSQGPPESYTSDPVILELLSAARSKLGHSPGMHPEVAYSQEQQPDATNVDPASTGFYPPPGAYYYPPMPMPPPMMPDGSVPYYVPHPPMPTDQNPNGLGNLPPPDVARMIPCRYYPACRYGASCMFAHPQGSYMQGSMPPPAQYPAPYDPMTPGPYPPPTYYPVPPSPYSASPNGVPNHMSPPPIAHTGSGSDVISPVQAPFSPVNGQPPVPYGVVSPVSPTYGHPAPVSIPGPVPSLPPLQTSPTVAQPPPQPGMYPPMSPNGQVVPPPYAIPPQYVASSVLNGDATDIISPKSPVHGHPSAEGYVPGPINREMSHHRRGGPRRPSFGGRGGKPPCLFFPSGRCRNGYASFAFSSMCERLYGDVAGTTAGSLTFFRMDLATTTHRIFPRGEVIGHALPFTQMVWPRWRRNLPS